MPRKRKDAKANKLPEVQAPSKSKKVKENEHPAKKIRREPEWIIGDGLNVTKVILSVQKNDCNSSKCLAELQKLYKKMSHSAFMKPLLMTLRAFLNQEEGNEFSIRVLKFIAIFIASFGEENTESGASHPVVESSFNELLGITCNQVHVRARICSLVTSIMTSFSQKAELDETIIERITERMLYFMRDTSPIVRAQAIFALQRLQDPDNINEDSVTKAYIHHMESDPAPKVRQAVITAIAKRIHTIPAILDRLQDVDEKVRRHTYLQMASYPVRSYKIVDRIAILNAGLNDRSDLVRKAVVNVLLSNWIGVYEFDYAEFIRAIKLDSQEKDLVKFRTLADMALDSIFIKRKIIDLIQYLNLSDTNEFKNCLTIDKSTLEQLIVWKMVIKNYQDYIDGKRKDGSDETQNNEDDSDQEETGSNQTISNVDIIPEMSIFCDYMDKFMNDFKFGPENEMKLQKSYFNQCILVLLEIVQLYDLGDEVGKSRLQDLLRSLLINFDLSEFSIQEVTKITEKIMTGTDARLSFFNKIITEMVKPGAPSEYSRQSVIDDLINKSDIDRKVKANDIKLRMMDLKEQESVLVERKHYAECQRVSEQYHKLNEELIELLKPVAERHSAESTQSLLENLTVAANIKKITPQEILKNLKICYFSIKTKGIKTITHDVLQIYNEFVRYYLESTDLSTRIWALKTATAYSLLYESIAKEIYVVLKSQVLKNVHVLLWECSIECIVDLLLRYSIEKMDGYDNNDPSLSMTQNRSKKSGRTLYTDIDQDEEDGLDEINFVKTLDITQMLTHLIEQTVDKRIIKTTIYGMCKLILHGVYSTRELLSKFLLMYFNPATDTEISQTLGIFLENLIKRKKQELIHDALIPTVITLLEAPYESPLREVKIETVLKYIVEATRPIFCSNGLNLHNTMSMKFLELMRDNPDSKEILRVFSKELLQLEIGEDPLLKKDLIKQIEQLLKDSSADFRAKKYMTDFVSILSGTYRAPLKFSSTAKTQNDEDEDEENVDEVEEDEGQLQVPTIPEEDEDNLVDGDIECKGVNLEITRLEIDAEMNKTLDLDQLNIESEKMVTDDVEKIEDSGEDLTKSQEDEKGEKTAIDSSKNPAQDQESLQNENLSLDENLALSQDASQGQNKIQTQSSTQDHEQNKKLATDQEKSQKSTQDQKSNQDQPRSRRLPRGRNLQQDKDLTTSKDLSQPKNPPRGKNQPEISINSSKSNITSPDPNTSSKSDKADRSQFEIDATLSEDIVIPASQHPQMELDETDIEHENIPATQELTASSIDNSISSNEVIPPTPVTPVTVVKKTGLTRKGQGIPMNSLVEVDEPSTTKKHATRSKRILETSKSTPITPSVSSPMRKAAKKLQITPMSASTPVSASIARKSQAISSPETPTLKSSSRAQMTPARLSTLPPSKASTPNTETRMTRNQSKAETTQNTTVTRSSSKKLNVRLSTSAKETDESKDAEKKKPTASKVPIRKGPAPPKIVPKSTRASRLAAKPASKEARPPWK